MCGVYAHPLNIHLSFCNFFEDRDLPIFFTHPHPEGRRSININRINEAMNE